MNFFDLTLSNAKDINIMLKESNAFCGFSVGDLEHAREFYGNTLGLDIRDNPMGLLELHVRNGNRVLIYPKSDHQPATFTVLNFPVTNIENVVDQLSAKGVNFENYGGEIKTDNRGIYSSPSGGLKIAWFKRSGRKYFIHIGGKKSVIAMKLQPLITP